MKQLLYITSFVILLIAIAGCSEDMSDNNIFNNYFTDIATSKISTETGTVYFEMDNKTKLYPTNNLNWSKEKINKRYYLEFSIINKNTFKNSISIHIIGYKDVKLLEIKNIDKDTLVGNNSSFRVWGNNNYINIISVYNELNKLNEAKLTIMNIDFKNSTVKLRFTHPKGNKNLSFHAFSADISSYIQQISSDYIIFEIDYWKEEKWNTETYFYERGKNNSIIK